MFHLKIVLCYVGLRKIKNGVSPNETTKNCRFRTWRPCNQNSKTCTKFMPLLFATLSRKDSCVKFICQLAQLSSGFWSPRALTDTESERLTLRDFPSQVDTFGIGTAEPSRFPLASLSTSNWNGAPSVPVRWPHSRRQARAASRTVALPGPADRHRRQNGDLTFELQIDNAMLGIK